MKINELKILIIINIIIFMIFLAFNIEDLNKYEKTYYKNTFTASDLKSITGTLVDDKYVINKEFNDIEELVFTYGPYVSLKTGSYKAYIKYKSNEDNSACIYSNEFKNLDYNVDLLKENNMAILNFSIPQNISDIEIQTKYHGKGKLLIESITIESTSTLLANNKTTFLIKTIFIIFVLLIFNILSYICIKNKNDLGIYILLISLGILLSYPLFYNQSLNGHDLNFHIGRIFGIRDGLLNGELFIKLQQNWLNNHGYLVGVFYGDSLLYIPAILSIFGITMENSYKMFITLINIVTILTSYYCFKNIFKNKKIGLLGATLYSMSIYRLVDIYIRHSVGEYCAFIFLPLIAYGFYLLLNPDNKKNIKCWILLSIGFSGLLNTHILSCEMVLIFILIFCIINFKKILRLQSLKMLCITGIVTILLNLGFLIPFLEYMIFKGGINITDASRNVFLLQDRGLFLTQLFNMFPNGSGINLEKNMGIAQEMPLTLGISLLMGIVLSTFIIFTIKEKSKLNKIFIYLGLSLLSIFMTTIYFPWDMFRKIPFLENPISSIQFPWRFLTIASLFLTLLICESIQLIKETQYSKYKINICMSLIIMSIITTCYFLNNIIINNDIIEFNSVSELNLTNTGDEYLPINTQTELLEDKITVLSGDIEIKNYLKKGLTVTFEYNTNQESILKIPLLNYGMYKAYINEHGSFLKTNITIDNNDNNIVTIAIPSNTNGIIKIYNEYPVYWKMAYIISILSWIIFILYLIYNKTKLISHDIKEI